MDTDLVQLVRVNADGMLVLDAAGDIRHANPAAARLLGGTVDDLIGQPFGIPLGTDDPDAKAVEIDVRRARSAGPTGTAELRAAPCRWDGAEATLVSLRDVTEHKRLIAELETKQRRLRRLSRALQQNQLAERARVAEQVDEAIGTPVRRARAAARAAAGRLGAGDERESLEGVVETLDATLEAAARAHEALFPPDLGDQGLVAALRWLASRSRVDRGLRVALRVEEGLEEPDDPRVRVFLFLAARALLDNVLQHAGTSEARLLLSTDPEDRLVLEVRDRGVGYETTRPHAPDRVARRPLRGLGLFNLRETLADRGGRLEIASGPGEGTSVRLTVPRDAMSGDDPAAAPTASGGEPAWSPL